MRVIVNKYRTGWWTGTKYQIAAYENVENKPIYFYGRTLEQAEQKFYLWLGRKIGEKHLEKAHRHQIQLVSTTLSITDDKGL